ncbi:hypothetical protein TNCV_3888241 [Trichonephila clavipes]|nr:hypothetical protein TNCV_3888241 [Trichonephila clavipes]
MGLVLITLTKDNKDEHITRYSYGGREIMASMEAVCCSLVVKVVDSWLAYHEFEPSNTEYPPRREGAAQVSSSSLYYGSKLRGPSPEALMQLNNATLIFTHCEISKSFANTVKFL